MPNVADLFLDKTANDKLHLYTAVRQASPGVYTVRALDAEYGDYGVTRLRSLVHLISTDLATVEPNMAAFVDANGDVAVDDRLPAAEVYFQYLISDSLAMQAMGYMLHHPAGTIEEFSQSVYLSTMTVIRRLKPLVDYLNEQYGIRINVRQLTFVGSEPLVRYMIFNLLVDVGLCSAKDYAVRYPELLPVVDRLGHYFNANAGPIVIKERLLVVLGVGLERARHGFAVEDTTIPDLWFRLPEKQMIADVFAARHIPNIEAEVAFAGFALFSGPVVLATSDRIHSLVCARLAQEADPWAKLTDELAETLANKMGGEPTHERWTVLLANTYLMLIPIFYFQQPLPVLFPLIRMQLTPNNRHYQELRRSIRAFWEKVARRKDCYWLHHTVDQLTNLLTYLFWPAYRAHYTTHHLRVSLRMGLSYHLQQPVRNLLEHIPLVDMIPYNPADPPDLLIVSAPRYVPKDWHGHVYHFGLASASSDTQQLQELINQAYGEKNAVD
jgi:hypothetical protein